MFAAESCLTMLGSESVLRILPPPACALPVAIVSFSNPRDCTTGRVGPTRAGEVLAGKSFGKPLGVSSPPAEGVCELPAPAGACPRPATGESDGSAAVLGRVEPLDKSPFFPSASPSFFSSSSCSSRKSGGGVRAGHVTLFGSHITVMGSAPTTTSPSANQHASYCMRVWRHMLQNLSLSVSKRTALSKRPASKAAAMPDQQCFTFTVLVGLL
mmetsp:Transcript_8703/g.19412  ORF Transcript_8703/g.19412 Transcript_8703/m.19412 type:complete len:213 (+) Transcript_8703:696-1334(+)